MSTLAEKMRARLGKTAPVVTPPPAPAPRVQTAAGKTYTADEVQAMLDEIDTRHTAALAARDTQLGDERSKRAAVEKARDKSAAELAEARTSFARSQIKQRAAALAAKLNAYDPEELSELIHSRLSIDEKGNVHDASDASKSAEDVVKQYLAERPHHARSGAATGGGTPTSAGKGAASPPAPDMAGKSLTEQSRMKIEQQVAQDRAARANRSS